MRGMMLCVNLQAFGLDRVNGHIRHFACLGVNVSLHTKRNQLSQLLNWGRSQPKEENSKPLNAPVILVDNNVDVPKHDPAPVKKIVALNEPQTCRNKGCGKTFKEKDNHDTACSYHPGPVVFHDKMRGVLEIITYNGHEMNESVPRSSFAFEKSCESSSLISGHASKPWASFGECLSGPSWDDNGLMGHNGARRKFGTPKPINNSDFVVKLYILLYTTSCPIEEVEILHDPKIVNHNHLMEAIEDTGFGAILISTGEDRSRIQLKIDGMRTDQSMRMVQNFLQALPGVEAIEFDSMLHKVSLSYKF
ncbi:hypothetical protein IFM89_032177 [Coptis chinensis]|uniref:CHORD domain-containing protein n=1 Tax=Coptis chinensis TaxID=261450 RepID=A0A835IZG7_9MAGN|nr:hypothetical protein IFM89_032177 [Coptis chinensis]